MPNQYHLKYTYTSGLRWEWLQRLSCSLSCSWNLTRTQLKRDIFFTEENNCQWVLTSVTKRAWKPGGTLCGRSTTATGSDDIVFASITCTADFLHITENIVFQSQRSNLFFLQFMLCEMTLKWVVPGILIVYKEY